MTTPLTVLHVITGLGSGGAERMLTRVATARMPDWPRQVVVSLTDEGMHGAALRACGVRVHCLGMRRGLPSPKAFLRLVRILRQERPNVVMSWLYHADLFATLAAPLAGRPALIWNLRCSDMDLTRYAPTTRWVLGLLVRLSGWPRAVAANSQAGREAHAALSYHPRKWAYLPNGFDMTEWRPDAIDRTEVREELGFDDEDVVVGLIARVDPQKDHATFLDAAADVAADDARLRVLLIGRGTGDLPVPARLAGRMVALGERSDVARLMRGLDVMVLSSAFGEGFPNVVGEAMATGVPCVVTDVGDAARLVGDRSLSIPPRDPKALAAALRGLLALPKPALAALGAAGRQRVTSAFSLEAVLADYAALWRDVVAEDQMRR